MTQEYEVTHDCMTSWKRVVVHELLTCSAGCHGCRVLTIIKMKVVPVQVLYWPVDLLLLLGLLCYIVLCVNTAVVSFNVFGYIITCCGLCTNYEDVKLIWCFR